MPTHASPFAPSLTAHSLTSSTQSTRSGHPTAVPVEPSKHPTLPKPQRTLTYIKVRCGLALIWVIGTYAVIIGVLLVALAFRLKKHTMVALRNGR